MNEVMLRAFYIEREFSIDFEMRDPATAERILHIITGEFNNGRSFVSFGYGDHGQHSAMLTREGLIAIRVNVPSVAPDLRSVLPDSPIYYPSGKPNEWKKLDKVPDHKPDPIFPSNADDLS